MNACGDVAFERTMCSAVRRRMLEKGTIWSPAARNEAMETGGACGARATGEAGAAWATRAAWGRWGGCAGGDGGGLRGWGRGGGGRACPRAGADRPRRVVPGDPTARAGARDLRF